jgi:hypothetical protein
MHVSLRTHPTSSYGIAGAWMELIVVYDKSNSLPVGLAMIIGFSSSLIMKIGKK